ncbi:MAG: ABC transporter permease [Endomicrobium sp.]|jgi:D-methionine transport system permease protein|nr:ABC transporter permease [Endomicrobium sp.]
MVDFFIKLFNQESLDIILPATWQTLYMVLIATPITVFLGLIFGISLYITDKNGFHPSPIFNRTFGAVINAVMALPSMIVIVLALPLSKFVLGVSYGPKACIIALTIVCTPIFSRLVENSILEVSKGKIEAAKSMGASIFDIIFKVMLPEAFPTLIRNFVVLTTTLISVTAIAGTFGAGGLGEVAVRFGYHRFRTDILLAAVLVLLVLVEVLQLLGDKLSKRILKKRHLI